MDIKAIEKENIIAWIMANNLVTERGVPFNFERFSFMIDPYNDWTPLQGVRKCTQIGWSVMTNMKLFFAAKYGIPGYGIPAANVIYTLPADKDVSDFVPSKTDLLIENNPTIKAMFDSKIDAVSRKKIGGSMVYFKGTRSKTAALMLSSDLNIHDEADRSEAEIVDQYQSRLDNSMYKGRWIFSNPSAPNMPADLMYQQSDQKHWFIKCEHCGHWQYIDWIKLSEVEFKVARHCYVDDTTEVYVCGKCARPITDQNRMRGKWVAKYPGRKISGYWISHMMCSWKSVSDLLDLEVGANRDGKGAKSTSYMHNFVKGIPYVGSSKVVDESTIVNNLVLDQVKWERGRVAMGIDNGDIKHYVIGDENRIWEYGSTRSWEDIESLIKKYDPYYVVDLNPYPNRPRQLTKKYRKGRASFYVDDKTTTELFEWGKIGTDRGNMVYPNREKVITRLVEWIFEGNLQFIGAKSKWEEYISHWGTLYQASMVSSKKIDTEVLANEQGLKDLRRVWLSSTGMDHYVHATVYWFVAMHRLMTGKAQVIDANHGAGSLKAIQKDLGVKRSAEVNIQAGTMKTTGRSFIPDMKQYGKKQGSRSGSVSGNM